MFLLIPLFLILTALLLLCSKDALALAGMGLTLWFENMVPTLLPFMILSGIITGLHLQYALCRPFCKMNQLLFHVKENETYCIVMGFLCGFPMGAFCACELCRKQLLSKERTQYLVSFCNNIGPVYFYNYALGMAGLNNPTILNYLLLTFGMYGIPFTYGILTRPSRNKNNEKSIDEIAPKPVSLFDAVDQAINRSGISILRLCGYMVLFNILMLPLYRFVDNRTITGVLHCFTEISGGIRMLHPLISPASTPFLKIMILTALSFGGLSCIGQTAVFLKEAELSLTNYIKSRCILAGISCLYYTLCFMTGLL